MEPTENGLFKPEKLSVNELDEIGKGEFSTPFEIIYQDPGGKIWTAPEATITDGASIPTPLAGFFGGKLNEDFLLAAIVHDAYCGRANKEGASYQIESWQDTHHMFYFACLANGTRPVTAKTMYAGVRLGGPRWELDGARSIGFEDLPRYNDNDMQNEMAYCKDWIEKGGDKLSLDDIDAWMDEREKKLLGK